MIDVIIAGGGPAGLATAIRARMAGLEVVVMDPLRPPIDRACGEGLMPDGAELLEKLGVDLSEVESRAFRGIRYRDGELVAEGRFPGAGGLGMRRTALHAAMCRRAEDLGVDLRWGVRATSIRQDGFETDEGLVAGRWLVAADGRTSRVRRWVGLDGRPTRRPRIGLRRHYAVEPWSDLVEVSWVDGCEAYVTPVGEGLVGVAMLFERGAMSFDELLRRFPKLELRLQGASIASKDRGSGPLEQRCRRIVCGNLALVGDASGYLDPITGEGLALSFHHAFAVVHAILAGDLSRYAAAHRRVGRYPKAITRLLLSIERHPGLRRRVMRSLAADPTLMARFLALKMNARGPHMLGGDGLLSLAAAAIRGSR